MTQRREDAKSMDANIVDLQTLFGKPVSYRIPYFQRPYAWNESSQWQPLWEDIRGIAERYLDQRLTGRVRPHFMGAIVLQQQSSGTGEVERRLVVDGQQRLTTLQLVIRSTQEVFQNMNDLERTERLQSLTVNDKSRWGGDTDNETKIRQSNVNDQKDFQQAIRRIRSAGISPHSNIGEAYQYFKDKIRRWLDEEPASRTLRANALEEVLTKFVQIAAIDLDEDEKPHIIFETLNARGEPLRQSDLVKNIVMYEANVIDDSQKASELWGMFEDTWWQEDSGEGRLDRPHIDRFLHYWMIMRSKSSIVAERVAMEFRNHLDQDHKEDCLSVEEITEDVRNAGKVYRDLESVSFPGLESFLRRMKCMEIGVVMPPLMWLCVSGVPEDRFVICIRALESYLVRRMLCGKQSMGLNKLFIDLISRLEDNGAHQADATVITYLRDQTVDNRIWPNDRMLDEILPKEPMRGNAPRRKMVMEAVELALRGDKSEPIGPTHTLTIEHVMPQQWQANWQLKSDETDISEAIEEREDAIKRIGNLTLVSDKLNKSLSNAPWSEKRVTLGKHSGLFLNKILIEKAPDTWDESVIEERGRRLTKIIKKIWPHADNLTEA